MTFMFIVARAVSGSFIVSIDMSMDMGISRVCPSAERDMSMPMTMSMCRLSTSCISETALVMADSKLSPQAESERASRMAMATARMRAGVFFMC